VSITLLAAKLPIVPDKDSPVYTAKQLARLYCGIKKNEYQADHA
jgi:hypothetical protein